MKVSLSSEVSAALAAHQPVVALESTIIAHGMAYPANVETALSVEQVVREIYHLAHDRKIEILLEKGDDDFSFSLPGVGRFRANTFRQRGSLAAVIRVVLFDLPNPAGAHTSVNFP